MEKTVRREVVQGAFEDWLLNMDAGMSPKVARELMEHHYEHFTEHEQLLLSDSMMKELEQRMEHK